MRPLRIELSGFSAYKAPVVVDFEDVEFFALTGPTGSGKSSLVDAMIFALYGKIPRLTGNSIAPAISAGSDEARVAFAFEVDGERYEVARFARRTEGGAGVREARLEGPVTANGVGEVNRAVEEVLALDYEDFIRTVVLPQGEFARFLKAKKSERQSLLRSLLGFDLYSRVGQLAKTRRAVAADRIQTATRDLEAIPPIDESDVEAGVRRVEALAEMHAEISTQEQQLATLQDEAEKAKESATRLHSSIARLGELAAPENLDRLGALTEAARSAVEKSELEVKTARDDLEATIAKRESHPSTDRIEFWAAAYRNLAELDNSYPDGGVETALKEVTRGADAATTELEAIESALADLRTRHLAHTLATALEAGAECPVCRQEITEIPERADLPEFTEMEDKKKAAERRVEDLERQSSSIRSHHIKFRTILEGLDGAPSASDLEELRDVTRQLDERVGELKADLAAKVRANAAAEAELERLAEAQNLLGHQLTEAVLPLAALEPSISSSDDPVVRWKELLEWRDGKKQELVGLVAEAEDAKLAASSSEAEARSAIEATLRAEGIAAEPPYADRIATAREMAQAEVKRLEETAKRRQSLSKTLQAATEEEAMAAALVSHLRVDGFERWLMVDALEQLVDGANELLADLSGGGYSLQVDDAGSFSVVDHRNADELRLVDTLSGGETFLASLALALALAETLASKGGSALDAVILDEGFGTLDDETLDVVASVLEELSGEGLMVGVITHVKELAIRAPARYEATRHPGGVDVTRIDS